MSSLTPEQNKIQNPLAGRAGWDRAEYGDGQFETGFFGQSQPAWHGLGNVISDDVLTSADAIKEAGLDWEVNLVPTYVSNQDAQGYQQHVAIPNNFAVQRDSDSKVLGTVGKRYVPVQNKDAFSFMDSILDSGEAKYHTAGSLSGGSVIWLLAKLGDDIYIDGLRDEAIQPFILLGNSHDGSSALTVNVTPIRVVCKNTLNLALGSTPRQWKARHTKGSLEGFAEARRTLGLTYKYIEEFQHLATNLVATKVSEDAFTKMVSVLFPVDEENDTERTKNTKREAQANILKLGKTAKNLENVRGTAWAALNAVGEYSDWSRNVRTTETTTAAEGRFKTTLKTDLKDSALSYIRDQFLVTA